MNFMIKLLSKLISLSFIVAMAYGCSSNTPDGTSGDVAGNDSQSNSESGNSTDTGYLGGYAHPDGVFILNQGAPMSENSSLTYIAPDGTVEEDVYRKVNGTSFGNYAQDMWMYNGKLYILSSGVYNPGGKEWDGVLVVADAVTLKLEKAYKMNELMFKRPQGSNEESELLPLNTPLENIAVLDEKNIFVQDGQGVFRFDSTTGEMNIVEGAYNFGNHGNTIENVALMRGVLRVGDCLYMGGGGFWQSTRFFELAKGKNEVNRVLPDLHGEFISGLCRTGEREVVYATCGRGGEKNSYLIFVDLDGWKTTEKKISEDISAEFFNTSGITKCGDYIYYAAGGTTVRRMSLLTWKAENYINVLDDAPEGKYLNCNVMADPSKQYLYVAVSNDFSESDISEYNYLLIYDCSGDKPLLVNKILNKTSYPIGIFPMRRFYTR